jgi:type I restriction enzyme M protein
MKENMNPPKNRRTKELSLEDIPSFFAPAPISKVAELDYVLTPGRYVGLPDDEDDFDFENDLPH